MPQNTDQTPLETTLWSAWRQLQRAAEMMDEEPDRFAAEDCDGYHCAKCAVVEAIVIVDRALDQTKAASAAQPALA